MRRKREKTYDGSKNRPSFQFYPEDWLTDFPLRMCSLAARGLWIDLLCWAHKGTPYGHVNFGDGICTDEMITRLASVQPEQGKTALAELEKHGVLSRTAKGVVFSRRMVKDEQRRKAFRKWYSGTQGLLLRIRKLVGGDVTEKDVETLFERQKHKCPYCEKDLPQRLSIDHITPLSRGGKNHLSNLALCCIKCNRLKHKKTPEEYKDYQLSKLLPNRDQSRSPSPPPSPSPDIKEKTSPDPAATGGTQEKTKGNGHDPNAVVFNRQPKLKDSDFAGPGVEKLLIRLREYQEEFGKSWCSAQWDAAVEWAYDNPKKAKKDWAAFVKTWFRNEAKRVRQGHGPF